MKSPNRNAGFTLAELMVAIFISLIVVLGLGRLILANQKALSWNREKATLQQSVTETLEWMSRSVREAYSLEVLNDAEFKTYDSAGLLNHRYRLDSSTDPPVMKEDSRQLSAWHCSGFQVACNTDTTSLTLNLEYSDTMGNSVGAMTRITKRNAE